MADEFADQVPDSHDAVLVAHSGAGPLLATIAQLSRAREPTLLFVDAGVSSAEVDGELMPLALLDHLESLAVDGVLPPWSQWFAAATMETLIPDEIRRTVVEEELPRLPLEYFYGSVAPTIPWPARHNGYIQLSDGYADDAQEARRRGWPSTVVANAIEQLGRAV